MTTRREVLSPLQKLEQVIRRVLNKIVPNLGQFDGPVFARIEKVNVAGGKVDINSKGISVDVQVLNADFSPNTDIEVIQDVPIDSMLFGDGGAVYGIPTKGSIVRVAFMYNNPGFPFILAVTNEGKTIPKATAGEFRIETADGIILQFSGKKINIKTENYNSNLEFLINFMLEHSHLGNMTAPTGPAPSSVVPIASATPPAPASPAVFKTGTL